MPHFHRVLGNVKNKKYAALLFDKQALVDMPHLPNIKLEVRYKFFAI
jgi:hypothetical protein